MAVAAAAASATSGCGGAVDVEPHPVTPGSDATCSEVLAALPEVVSDAVRRQVSGDPPGVAAWGAPPIILRCGVPPARRRLDAQVYALDGVDWYAQAGQGGFFFTSVGRSPVIQVAVPDDYAPEVEVLVGIGAAVRLTGADSPN